MASGQVNEYIKLYLYSQASDSGAFLMEFMLNTISMDISITFKTDRTDLAELYGNYLLSTLSPIIIG